MDILPACRAGVKIDGSGRPVLWFVPERLSDDAARLLDDQHELASPDLMWAEIGNVVWKKSRAGQLTGQEAARIIRALDDFPVTVFPSQLVLEGALEIALGIGRSIRDPPTSFR